MSLLSRKPKPVPEPVHKPAPSEHLFTQECDEPAGCKRTALLKNHKSWTAPVIGTMHQYYCDEHWPAQLEKMARKAEQAKKGTPALVEKGKKHEH